MIIFALAKSNRYVIDQNAKVVVKLRNIKIEVPYSALTTFHTPKRAFHTMGRVKRLGTLFFILLLQPVRILQWQSAAENGINNFKKHVL